MGPESCVFITLFKSTIYVFLFVAQGLNEIVMMTMVIMMITDFATFCYSPARMQEESLLSTSERSNLGGDQGQTARETSPDPLIFNNAFDLNSLKSLTLGPDEFLHLTAFQDRMIQSTTRVRSAPWTWLLSYLVVTVHLAAGRPSDSAVTTSGPVWPRLALTITRASPLKALRS